MDAKRELFVRSLREVLNGRRFNPDRRISGLISMVLQRYLPRPIAESVLTLTHFRYVSGLDSAMQVELDRQHGIILLRMDMSFLDALLVASEQDFIAEVSHLLHHELAHVLLGHLYGPLEEFSDAMMTMAKEIAVNDGWLRLGETVYPFVRLDNFPFADAVRQYAKEHGYPDDWLQNYLLVYRALVSTVGNAAFAQRSDIPDLLERWGAKDAPVTDYAEALPPSARVMVIYDGTRVQIYPVTQLQGDGSLDQSQRLRRIHEMVRPALLEDGRYQYDPARNSFRYSPQGFSPEERVVRIHGYRVPWHLIRRLFGVRDVLSYNRRYGHLYPPDQMPLVSEQSAPKTVDVFYDSSGSVPDEVLGGFIGTMRRSPFRIREHYFSVQVTDRPHGGGTSFQCIEEYLLQQQDYPDVVVVLTDGQDYGPPFTPRYPERWHWIVYGNTSVPERIGGTVIRIEDAYSYG